MEIKQIIIDDIKTDYSVTDTGLIIRTNNNKISIIYQIYSTNGIKTYLFLILIINFSKI